MEKETTTHEILEAINDFFHHIDGKFNDIDKRFDGIDNRLDGIDNRLDGVDGRLNKIEATMVTKDYLDDKLADLRGDMVVLMRKEDTKLKKLVDILGKRKVLSEDESNEILGMEPFAPIRL